MPITWSDDELRGWVVLAYADPYTFDEHTRAMDEVLARRGHTGALRLLVDRRDAAAPTKDFAEHVMSYIKAHVSSLDGARIALVGAGEVGFGMGRLMQIRAEQTMTTIAV